MGIEKEQSAGSNGSGTAVEAFITKKEVARRFGRSLSTIEKWMQQGVLPYYKIGKVVSFRWSEVEGTLVRNFRVNHLGGAN